MKGKISASDLKTAEQFIRQNPNEEGRYQAAIAFILNKAYGLNLDDLRKMTKDEILAKLKDIDVIPLT